MQDYVFSDKIASLQPSAIREILKRTSDPSIIPFSAGNPAVEAFPVETIRAITAQILTEHPITALQYGVTEGYPPLIEAVKRMVAERADSYNPDTDEVLIVSGAQQGIELFTKCIVNEGDAVITENPSFIGSLNTFRSYNVRLLGVDMAEDGLDLGQLEQLLRNQRGVKFLYVIPNFQNPTGATMSLEKRKGVLALAKQYDLLILEDNPYGELRFAGEPLPTIKSMDAEGRVVYVGSFSKILSPGLRLGYAVAPKAIVAKMTVAKQGADVHTAMLSQMIAERFLATVDFDAHIAKLRSIYRRKATLMMEQMDRCFSPRLRYIRPQGGLFMWCMLPDEADMVEFCKRAVDRGVACVPGTAFLPDTTGVSHCFRVNYATPSEEQIVRGIEILGALSREML